MNRDTRSEVKKASGRLYMISGSPRGFWRKCRASFQKKKRDHGKHGDDDEHPNQGAAQAFELVEDLVSVHFPDFIAPSHLKKLYDEGKGLERLNFKLQIPNLK
jgi:hypothetical protein